MSESRLLYDLLLRCSQLGAKLWRNQSGAHQNPAGQWIRYGLANPGGSDLIGYVPVVIRPEHVGQTLAVFVAIEAKTAGGKVRPEQADFLRVVGSQGAVTCLARSVADAETALAPWLA